METPTLEVELDAQPIELCKLLKVVDLVSGGGEAKLVISEGYVYLNGQLETQKRKKIYHNDIVTFNGETILVICHAPVTSKEKSQLDNATQKEKSAKKLNKPAPSRSKRKLKDQQNNISSGKRRPINF
ncbi:RNA-binding S4 domain-containing protein [Thalassotalea ganghwensis]